ncbi:hypothetical protein MMC16_000455 [Acarospora aff. strigata]|nr:hypothetical protein [Acarospora aff. strigata]
MRELDPLITEYSHEAHRPRAADALQTLRKVASLVKPLMRQRNWHVHILAEFYPDEKNLLGLNHNHGEKICLRLRYPYDERQFLPTEEVVDTMLHELAHIVHGPHDAQFHALWNQLREEHEQLARKGYTGEGFLSEGKKLGGRRIPLDEARRRARAAAEQRRTLTAGSGQKLGGAPVRRGADIRKVIADAATRRTAVTQGCGSGRKESKGIAEEVGRNGFRTKAEEDDANDDAIMQAYIELLQEEEKEKYGEAYVPPSQGNPTGSSYGPSSSTSKTASATPMTTKPSSDIHPVVSPPTPTDTWTCPICTLRNPTTYLCCDACTTERPSSSFIPKTQTRSHTQNHPTSTSLETRRQRLPPAKNVFKPASSSNKALQTLSALDAATRNKPLGWLCQRCGTFMESEWWTCAGCGGMKTSS